MAQAPTPDVVKRKKSKDGSAKKRKREEGQTANAHADGEPTAKKSKKRKSKGGEGGTTEAAPTAVPDATPVVGPDEQAVPQVDEIETPTVEIKEKKEKKKKKQKPADTIVPVTEPATDATPDKKSKGRKVRAPNEAQSAAGSSKDVGHSSTDRSQPQIQSDEVLERHTPFQQQTSSFYLALSPCAQSFPVEGLCAEHISPLLLTYFAPLKGVVISYSNPRLSEGPEDVYPSSSKKSVLAQSIDEYAVNFVWLTADFTIFRPSIGTYLEGYVNLQNESLLGLVCYNYFNAGIDRTRLPKEWKWVGDDDASSKRQNGLKEGGGYWVDGEGKKVEGRLVFKVKDFEPTPAADGTVGSINVAGTMLGEVDDRKMDEQESRRR
ncbi:SHS2 domain [Teratosphaeria destructans]|uniref:DNA-directed RNA polymerase subunit n=1 Tax=Teratosphaeria destructans TaxID=418781 RepID=A0A9W7W5V7_9PEZI|nr:SHS2 domain [Teratosphaeria destructans]